MKICVLCGGWSSEREISLRSGAGVYSALKKLGYDAHLVDMERNFEKQLEEFDIVYIMLHGKPGEDGTIQSYLDLKNKKYTGSGPFASFIGIDKVIFKNLLVQNNILTPKFFGFSKEDKLDDILRKALDFFKFPIVVKPRYEGSSVGVYIVKNREELEIAISEVSNRYGFGIIEEFIKGREITIGILGTGKDAIALPILEIRPIISEFYDYKAKYTKGGSEYILPNIDKTLTRKIEEIALNIHRMVNCVAFSRVDAILKDDALYVLEINTIPGMTETSLLPKSASAIGMSYEKLVEFILNDSLSIR
ncbi:MAG: D-alanine--D-alanine ligase [candidate division WOR-3 bacterium]|nr:D-alanine--D-alanine ligase [candidate division WOR-3 bacterium]MCX7948025.1 D-alanine--D-alanine ligase [candidate division WOR-3 bacterium]MDW8151077.1 D-alanine--D-alanine ligase [candidate division WOR-3 bacterium]